MINIGRDPIMKKNDQLSGGNAAGASTAGRVEKPGRSTAKEQCPRGFVPGMYVHGLARDAGTEPRGRD